MANLDEKTAYASTADETTTNDHNRNVFATPKSSLSLHTTPSSAPIRPNHAATPSITIDHHDLSADHEKDLEKGMTTPSATVPPSNRSSLNPLYEPCRVYSVASNVQECSMWPSRQTMRNKAKQDKCDRRAGNLLGLSKKWGDLPARKRMALKILLALLLVGLAVGVAIGITRAVHGGVWARNGSSTQISDPR